MSVNISEIFGSNVFSMSVMRERLPKKAYAEVVDVMENGLEYVAGTDLERVPEAVRARIRDAKLVIAKGQGNFETLHDCGLNIYYLFLCKCRWFTELFHTAPFTGMFVNERRLDF